MPSHFWKWCCFYRRKIVLVTTLMLIIPFCFCFAYEGRPPGKPEQPDISKWTEEQLNDSALLRSSYWLVDNIVDPGHYEELSELLGIEISENSLTCGGITVSNGLSTVIKYIHDSAVNIAIVLAVILLPASIINAAVREQMADDLLIMHFTKVGISIALIAISFDLCINVVNFGGGWAKQVGDKIISYLSSPDVSDKVTALKQSMLDMAYPDKDWGIGTYGWGDTFEGNVIYIASNFSFIALLIIPAFCMIICNTYIKFVCWGRAIKCLVLATFSPLAFCDISNVGGMGNTGRFIKTLAAVALQGAVIMAVCFIGTSFQFEIIAQSIDSGEFEKFASACWDIVLIGFATAGMVKESLSMSRDVIGVS